MEVVTRRVLNLGAGTEPTLMTIRPKLIGALKKNAPACAAFNYGTIPIFERSLTMAEIQYDKAGPDEEVHSFVRDIMERYHPHLKIAPDLEGDEAWAKLTILWAFRGDDSQSTDPVIKDGQYPAIASIKAIPYVQRVDGRADAQILIDQKQFESMSENRQRAILDHCITSLEISLDDKGFVKTDDAGRPKLKIRECDWFLKGFRSIAERYGEDAHEVMQAKAFEKSFGAVTLRAKEPAWFAQR